MHFLCLHGRGTNGRIFEAQTAAIRQAVGSGHTYEFIDGGVVAPAAFTYISSSETESLQFVDENSLESCRKGLMDLIAFIEEEGPFDGVMGFSQGAGLAVSYLIHQTQEKPKTSRSSPRIRCAILFSGGAKDDPRGLFGNGPRRAMSLEEDGEVIEIPTLHVWGHKDPNYPEFGPVLLGLCEKGEREEFFHDGGHEIPGAKDAAAVEKVAKLFKRTVQRAETAW